MQKLKRWLKIRRTLTSAWIETEKLGISILIK